MESMPSERRFGGKNAVCCHMLFPRLGSPPLPSPPYRVDESILIGRGGDGLGGDGGRQKAAKVIVGLIVLQVSYTEVVCFAK